MGTRSAPMSPKALLGAAPKAKGKPKGKAKAKPRAKPPENKYGNWVGGARAATATDLAKLWRFHQVDEGPVPDHHALGAIIVGWRKDEQTQSLMVYFELDHTRVRQSQLTKWFPNIEWEPRTGSALAAVDYCRKWSDTHRERGAFSYQKPAEEEEPRDLAWAHARIQAKDIWPEVIADRELIKWVAGRMRWARAVFDSRPLPPIQLDTHAEGFQWQARFEVFLHRCPADDETVTYVYDPVGRRGKSKFAKYMCQRWHREFMWASPSDRVANASLWEGQKAVFVDLPRGAFLSWGAMAQIKDGVMLQTKYEVCMKNFQSPHLVILSNEPPEQWPLRANSELKLNLITDLQDYMALHDFFPPAACPGSERLQDPFGAEPAARGELRAGPGQRERALEDTEGLAESGARARLALEDKV